VPGRVWIRQLALQTYPVAARVKPRKQAAGRLQSRSGEGERRRCLHLTADCDSGALVTDAEIGQEATHTRALCRARSGVFLFFLSSFLFLFLPLFRIVSISGNGKSQIGRRIVCLREVRSVAH